MILKTPKIQMEGRKWIAAAAEVVESPFGAKKRVLAVTRSKELTFFKPVEQPKGASGAGLTGCGFFFKILNKWSGDELIGMLLFQLNSFTMWLWYLYRDWDILLF